MVTYKGPEDMAGFVLLSLVFIAEAELLELLAVGT